LEKERLQGAIQSVPPGFKMAEEILMAVALTPHTILSFAFSHQSQEMCVCV
jgi:hypothetical protein